MRIFSSTVTTTTIAALVFMLVWVAPASSQEEPPLDEVCSQEQCADDPALQDQCETFLTVCLAEANTDADAEQCFGAAILICNATEEDADGDGVPDAEDNCPVNANTDQGDEDGDGIGDACDSEEPSPAENLAFLPSVYLLLLLTEQAPADEPEPPPADTDGDGVPDAEDNCPSTPNADQADADGDSIGDACDSEEPPPGDEAILEACSQAECTDDPALQDFCVAFMTICLAEANTGADAEKCFGGAILICRDFE